jgi:uncharacterized surface protein with fasciclin (FAS1) repeats
MRTLFGFLAALALSAPAFAADKDIVDTAAGEAQFKTLVAALKAADLADALKGPGPFTLFAPTDDAFAKLPPGTLEDLLKPENKERLAAMLKYHVVEGKVMAADVIRLNGKTVKTLEGSPAPVKVSLGEVTVGKAKVTKTNIPCTNGVIHIVDTVLLPPDK